MTSGGSLLLCCPVRSAASKPRVHVDLAHLQVAPVKSYAGDSISKGAVGWEAGP